MNDDIFTLDEFLEKYKMSRTTFYFLRKKNLAPKIIQISRKIIITKEAALEWQRSMEK